MTTNCERDGPWPEVVFNDTYGIFIHSDRLDVVRLDNAESARRRSIIPHITPGTPSPQASIGKDWLAVAHGAEIAIYDLRDLNSVCTLASIGRVATALCWYGRTPRLAVGYVDGTIAAWDIRTPRLPLLRLPTAGDPCQSISFKSGSDDIFAVVHRSSIAIWSLQRGILQSTIKDDAIGGDLKILVWQPGQASDHLAALTSDELRLYKANDDLSNSLAPSLDGDLDIGDEFRAPTYESEAFAPECIRRLPGAASTVQWLNNHLILVQVGREVLIFDYEEHRKKLSSLWTCELESSITIAHLRSADHSAHLMTLDGDSCITYDLPADVFDRLRSTEDPDASGHNVDVDRPSTTNVHARSITADIALDLPTPSSGMRPIPISTLCMRSSSFSKTSRQLQRQKTALTRRSTADHVVASPERVDRPSPQIPSMTSSLELPKPNGSYHNSSPMPFLSPSIPARNSPQTVIAPLDESMLELPPLPESFNASSTTAIPLDEDDDSDDEAFVDRLQGSGTFLPGGIHVPLPKACGALFAPNGQLLTFFPPKAQPMVVQQDAAAVSPTREKRPQVKKTTRLFPTFGNLAGDAHFYSDDTDSKSSTESSQQGGEELQWIDFLLQPSSFQSQRSWQARISPVKPVFGVSETTNKIRISIYELEEASLTTKSQQSLAGEYRYLREEYESGADLCKHNAIVAQLAGMLDISHIWTLLAMLIEDKVPLKALAEDQKDVLVVAQRALLLQNEDAASFNHSSIHHEPFGHLRWVESAFGRAWLLPAIFDWAEKSADVQHLASFAAVLAEPHRSAESTAPAFDSAFLKKLASYSVEYEVDEYFSQTSFQQIPQPTPIVRPPAAQIQLPILHEAPIKRKQLSIPSSQNTSQPNTPHLEASSTTPPYSLPSLSRQGSRLSASGSASPETHRSSFSAAAKSYAQSITDKFASYTAYGTSPPARKLGGSISPGNNDLSTSLPSGSWTKSVSFANSSTPAATNRASQLSRSFDEQYVEDAYDSDKTIEDNSLPQTPKSGSGPIVVTHKNRGLFDDECSGGAKIPMLPREIAEKAEVWGQYYAEQLRTWGFWMKAAELEKVVGITAAGPADDIDPEVNRDRIIPVPVQSKSSADVCVICTTKLRSTEVLCSACRHTSHIACFTEYSFALNGEEFRCPAGCDCTCSALPFVVEEVAVPSPQRPLFKKKPSFTDPRRWRARNEGDSW